MFFALDVATSIVLSEEKYLNSNKFCFKFFSRDKKDGKDLYVNIVPQKGIEIIMWKFYTVTFSPVNGPSLEQLCQIPFVPEKDDHPS